MKLEELLKTEDENLEKMHKIVADSLKEEESLVDILYKESESDNPTLGQVLADKVASFGGSWSFIILFTVILTIWIIFNIYYTAKIFDPYPFILLNLILSCIAALQAPVIMMSQNRKDTKDRRRSEHDYLVNLKAELQIRELNQKIDLLMVDQMSVFLKLQNEQFNSINAIKEKLDNHLNNSNK
jgi:uncharacterized membrane protein